MNNMFSTETLEEMSIRNRSLAEASNHKNIICPAIYKHFKNKFYATMGISEAIETSKIEEWGQSKFKSSVEAITNARMDFIYCKHTETDTNLLVINIYGKLYHPKEKEPNQLVLYKSLYDDTGVYVRPLKIFASEVDKEKHHDIEQKYRFELVRY